MRILSGYRPMGFLAALAVLIFLMLALYRPAPPPPAETDSDPRPQLSQRAGQSASASAATPATAAPRREEPATAAADPAPDFQPPVWNSLFGNVYRRDADGTTHPLTGAQVSLVDLPRPTAVTDASGRYTMDGVTTDAVRLRVEAGPDVTDDRYAPFHLLTPGAPNGPFDVVFSGPMSLLVSVHDRHTSRPIPDAEVTVEGDGPLAGQDALGTLRTDKDGFCEFEPLKEGRYRLNVVAEDYAAKLSIASVQGGRENIHPVTLNKGGTIYVQAVLENDEPASGACIGLRDYHGPIASIMTDENGLGVFRNVNTELLLSLSPIQYALVNDMDYILAHGSSAYVPVYFDDTATTSERMILRGSQGKALREVLEIYAKKAPEDQDFISGKNCFSGRVIDEAGRPVGGIAFAFVTIDGDRIHSITDSEGYFYFRNVFAPKGQSQIIMMTNKYIVLNKSYVNFGRITNYIVKPSDKEQLSLKVKHAMTGFPIPYYEVYLDGERVHSRWHSIKDGHTVYSPDGIMFFDGIYYDGYVNITVRADGYTAQRSGFQSTYKGPRPWSVEFSLTPAKQVKGLVKNAATGLPVANARLALSDLSSNIYRVVEWRVVSENFYNVRTLDARVASNAEGYFEFQFYSDNYVLYIQHPDYEPLMAKVVDNAYFDEQFDIHVFPMKRNFE